MKFTFSRGLLIALGMTCTTVLQAQADEGYGSPSLLPIPAAGADYGVQQTASFRRFQAEEATEGDPMLTPAQGDGLPSPRQVPESISPYDAPMGGAWADQGNASYGPGGCNGGAYVDGGACGPVCCNPCQTWWVGANFLYMGRNREDFQQLSFDDTDLVGSVLNTNTPSMNWSPGFEIFAGKWFCGGAYGVEARYWGIFPSNQESTVLASQIPGNLNTVFDFSPLNIGATNVNGLYDAAQAHRVRRSWGFQNVEVNWLQGYGYNWNTANQGLNVGLIAGVRYLNFNEGFQYASSDGSPTFGVDPTNEAYYDINVQNNLIGFQIGTNASYYAGPRFRLRATPKVGVYNNHMSQVQRIYNINGIAVVGPGNPLAGAAYDVNSSSDDISFLAEIDLGIDYRLTNHWVLNVGYRAVGLTGVGLATHQIPRNFGDVPGAQDIDNDQSLILHGGYVGATFLW